MSGSRVLQVSIEGKVAWLTKRICKNSHMPGKLIIWLSFCQNDCFFKSASSSRGASSALERSDSLSSTVLPIFLPFLGDSCNQS